MFTIIKEFTFEAAHQLNGLPEGHKCGHIHGHSYTATLVLSARDLDATGFVTDFGNLAPFSDYLATTLDHRILNEVLLSHDRDTEPVEALPQPSSEHLARHLYDSAVRILPAGIARL